MIESKYVFRVKIMATFLLLLTTYMIFSYHSVKYYSVEYISSITESSAEVNDVSSDLALSVLISHAVFLIIIIPLLFLFLPRLFRNIVNLRNLTQGLSDRNGDLTRTINISSNDEFSVIGNAINNFIINLRVKVLEISSSSDKIQKEISLLSKKTEENKSLIEEHTIETEKVVTAINELSATADSIAVTSDYVAKLTNDTQQEAEISKEVVEQSVSSALLLIDDIAQASDSIEKMNKHFNQIDSVLNVIGEIAEQTNLLALNAAIEAARAGEQGRGFAVVADEVRTLAARTQQSTAEIDKMMNNLRNATKNVVNSMEKTQLSGGETAENASKVMTSLHAMASSIYKVNESVSEIASSATEQSIVTEDINKKIFAIHEMISILESNSSDVVLGAYQIMTSNQQLVEIVGGFRLK